MAKTLRSRIAAVAVAALGMGLLQAAPAFAGSIAVTGLAINGVDQGNSTSSSNAKSITVLSGTTVNVSLTHTSTTPDGLVITSSTNSDYTTGASNLTLASTSFASSGTTTTTTFTAPAAGTYYLAIALEATSGGATSEWLVLTTTASPSASSATAVSTAGVARVGVSEMIVAATVVVPTGEVAGTNTAHIALAPAGKPAGSTVTFTSTDIQLPADSSNLGAVRVTFRATGGSAVITAGTYNFIVWVDNSYNGVTQTYPLSTAKVSNIAVVAGGVPASATVSAAKTAAVAGSGETTTSFTVNVKDAAGVNTLLTGVEQLSVSTGAGVIHSAVAGSGITTTSLVLNPIGGSGIAQSATTGTGSWTFYAGLSTAGTAVITVKGSQLLSGLVPAVTTSLTTFAASVLTTKGGLYFDSVTGIVTSTTSQIANAAYTAGTAYTSATSFYVSPSTKTIKVRVGDASTEADLANTKAVVSIAGVGSSPLPAGVTATSGTMDIDSASDGSYTVTSTGPVSGDKMVLTIGGVALTFNWGTPVPTYISVGPATTVLAAKASTTNVTATVLDQYGVGYAGALVTFVTSNSSANRAGASKVLGNATTSSTGSATFAFTDSALASNLATSDVITANAQWVGGNTTLDPATGTQSVNGTTNRQTVTINYVTSIDVATVTVAFDNTDAQLSTATPFTALKPGSPVDNYLNYTVTVRDSAGALVTGVPVTVTYTGGVDGSYGTPTRTKYTSAGTATFTMLVTKTGALSVAATVAGKSGTDADVTGFNTTSDARTITLDAATYTAAAGGLKRVSATVKDRYGNPVSDLTVTFTMTGSGRFAGGALSTTGITNASGVAVADLAPLTTETGAGTVTVTFSGGDAATASDTQFGTEAGTDYPARVAKATAATAISGVVTDSTVTAIQAQVTSVQTAMSTLVASVTATLTLMQAQIAKIMKKLGIK